MAKQKNAEKLLALQAQVEAQGTIIGMLFNALLHHRLVDAQRLVDQLDSLIEQTPAPSVDPAYSVEFRGEIDAWADVFAAATHNEISPAFSWR